MRHELGHTLLARLGKKRLRPGGIEATNWLLSHINFETSPKILEVACNMGTNMIELAKKYGCHIIGLDQNEQALEKAKANSLSHYIVNALRGRKAAADTSTDIVNADNDEHDKSDQKEDENK